MDRRTTLLLKMQGKNKGLAWSLTDDADRRLSPLPTWQWLTICERLSKVTSPQFVVDKSIALLPPYVKARTEVAVKMARGLKCKTALLLARFFADTVPLTPPAGMRIGAMIATVARKCLKVASMC